MFDLSNQKLCGCALGASLIVIIATYLAFSRRYGSYVNVLTPFVLVGVPSYYILESLNLALFSYDGSVYAYTYVYATYAAGVVARAIGYLAAPRRYLPTFLQLPLISIGGLPFLLLAFGYVLYAPILIRYSAFLTNPRHIYELTRTGYGIQGFLSTFLVYTAFVVLLMRGNRTSRVVMFAIPALALLYLHGSKGQIFGFFLIWLYFVSFVAGRRFAIGRLISLALISFISMSTLFYLTEPASFKEDLLRSVVGYAGEYTRNAMMVIDDNSLEPQYGRLALENGYYGLIPRQFFPDKRKDFGSLWLANRYFPERFQTEAGAPAFGLGVLYADFGVFAIFYYAVGEFLTGIFLKFLSVRLQIRPDAGTFVLFLVLMEVPLIPTGAGVSIFVYYLLAQFIKCIAGKPALNPFARAAMNQA